MAEKLPSGRWRASVLDGKKPDGSRNYERFTADTEEEADFLAAEFRFKRERENKPENITLTKALDRYIESRSNIISPATVRNYRMYQRGSFKDIMQLPIKDITEEKMQLSINEAAKTQSPKTIKNGYHLLLTALRYAGNKADFRVRLPKAQQSDIIIPTEEQTKTLIDFIAGTYMELPVLFAVCFAMRRAEVTALEWKDVDLDNKIITVRQARVMGDDGKYHIKATKNYTEHKVSIPDFLNDKLKVTERTSDYVCDILPNTLTRRFATLRDRLGMPGIRFHDLRHFNASVMAMLNIPDKYQMERGGWKTKHILNRVYQHTFSEKRTEVDSTVNNYLEGLLHHDMHHDEN